MNKIKKLYRVWYAFVCTELLLLARRGERSKYHVLHIQSSFLPQEDVNSAPLLSKGQQGHSLEAAQKHPARCPLSRNFLPNKVRRAW